MLGQLFIDILTLVNLGKCIGANYIVCNMETFPYIALYNLESLTDRSCCMSLFQNTFSHIVVSSAFHLIVYN